MAVFTQGTGMLYYTATAAQAETGRFRIMGVYWMSDQAANKDIAANDDFLLSDAAGNRIAGKRAEAAGDGLELSLAKPQFVNGFTVTTMDGGVCYIWIQ